MDHDNDTPREGEELPVDVTVDEGEVHRRLWQKFRQSPFAIYPASAAIIGTIAALFTDSPISVLGGFIGFLGLIGTGISAAYFWSYLRDPIRRTVALEQTLREQKTEEDRIAELCEQLRTAQLEEGVRVLAGLQSNFQDFQRFLESDMATNAGVDIAGIGIEAKVNRVYEQALRNLVQACEKQRAIASSDSADLSDELAGSERELKRIKTKRQLTPSDTGQTKILEARIASLESRISLREKVAQDVNNLIGLASNAGAAIEVARIKAVDLAERSRDSLNRTGEQDDDPAKALDECLRIGEAANRRLAQATAVDDHAKELDNELREVGIRRRDQQGRS